jgi:hypothetical protein
LPLEKQALMLREDWLAKNCSDIKNLLDVYGTDGFKEFKSKEDYCSDL